MANLSNINDKFLVTTGGNVLIGQTAAVGSSILQITGASSPLAIHTPSGNNGLEFILDNGLYTNWQIGVQNQVGNALTIVPSTAAGNTTFSTPVATFLSSGKVGIGTDTPQAALTVVKDLGGGGDATGFRLNAVSGATSNTLFGGPVSSGNYSFFQAYKEGTSAGVRSLNLNPIGGYVGIGTTSPGYKLDVRGAGAVSMIRTPDTTSPTLGLFVNDGSNGIGTISVDNGGHMTFDTGSTGAGQAERMRIDSSGHTSIYGRLGVGDAGAGASSQQLKVRGDSNSSDIMMQIDNTKYGSTDSSGESKIVFGWNNHSAANISAYKDGTVNRTGFKFVTEVGYNVPVEAMRITSGGNVEQGTVGTTASAYYYFNATTGGDTGIIFRDNASTNSGFLTYNHSIDAMKFATGGTERMRIDSSGNLKLAITNATSNTVIGKDGTGMWMETAGSTDALSDMRFQARASGAGSYSAIKIKPSNQSLEFQTSNAVRMRITAAGETILFPATGSYGLSQNDVNQVMNSGYIAGYTAVTYTYTCSSMSSMFIECVFNHYGLIGGYGCAFVAVFSNGPNITSNTILSVTSGNGGSWSIARVNDTTFTVTKNAGTYAGAGYYYIKINGARVFAA